MSYLLPFHRNNVHARAPRSYGIRTLPCFADTGFITLSTGHHIVKLLLDFKSLKLIETMFKNTVSTLQRTKIFSIIILTQTMLYKEMIAVSCDSNVNNVVTLCGQNAQCLKVITRG
jgi:hypothetical protein